MAEAILRVAARAEGQDGDVNTVKLGYILRTEVAEKDRYKIHDGVYQRILGRRLN
jgi:hypothetical protein